MSTVSETVIYKNSNTFNKPNDDCTFTNKQ